MKISVIWAIIYFYMKSPTEKQQAVPLNREYMLLFSPNYCCCQGVDNIQEETQDLN